MSKELEELERLTEYFEPYEDENNSKPSEALKYVDKILGYFGKAQIETMTLSKCDILTIKQTLIKAQEQEKVLEIIFEKGLSLTERDIIKQSENYKQYQIKISWWNYKPFAIPKSKEEFDLLKRWINGNISSNRTNL